MSTKPWGELGENLILILSPERSGSTMLQYMLESHSRITGLTEPDVLVSMKNLGYYGTPQKAEYETVNQSLGLKEFVQKLPRQEATYLDACRAYSNLLYRAARDNTPDADYFLDKTPSNVLVWDYIVRLYPRAKYIVLCRHPLAIIHSYAKSFFVGDYNLMKKERTRIPDFIRSVAAFLKHSEVPHIKVNYEDLVFSPQAEAEKILSFLELPFEDNVVEYGSQPHGEGSKGDPINARKEQRPKAHYADAWRSEFEQDPSKKEVADNLLAELSDEDLSQYGYLRSDLYESVASGESSRKSGKSSGFTFYHFRRRIYFFLKGLMRFSFFRKTTEGLRYICDVLLRD